MRRDKVDPRRYARGGWSGGLRGVRRGGISWWTPDRSEDTGRCQRRCHGRIDAAEAQQAVAVSGVVAERLRARFTLVVRPSGQQMRSIALRDANTTRLPAKPSSTCCESCHRATPIRGGLRPPRPIDSVTDVACGTRTSRLTSQNLVAGPPTKRSTPWLEHPARASSWEQGLSPASNVCGTRLPGIAPIARRAGPPGSRCGWPSSTTDDRLTRRSWVARRPTPLPRVRARLCAP